uniref:Uncharacterized protein n=1 Tax=Dunaliella tertiolecta TaxID=3047 RepID=A0A7S3QZ04_DUNTE|mmetsp:Transcript_9089/g.24471  ORF Transcript_9089/g.24471 Transcript_9089/m.24471 type:complete len:322 (+) Transcript_9089:1479-2444(+)
MGALQQQQQQQDCDVQVLRFSTPSLPSGGGQDHAWPHPQPQQRQQLLVPQQALHPCSAPGAAGRVVSSLRRRAASDASGEAGAALNTRAETQLTAAGTGGRAGAQAANEGSSSCADGVLLRNLQQDPTLGGSEGAARPMDVRAHRTAGVGSRCRDARLKAHHQTEQESLAQWQVRFWYLCPCLSANALALVPMPWCLLQVWALVPGYHTEPSHLCTSSSLVMPLSDQHTTHRQHLCSTLDTSTLSSHRLHLKHHEALTPVLFQVIACIQSITKSWPAIISSSGRQATPHPQQLLHAPASARVLIAAPAAHHAHGSRCVCPG